ncbi:MAG: hypothetical protein LBP87_02665 [Planctomycetaceae bacterium]|jgi:hypothetical protein|nr:hypothetical protein [Planctomycetaceae bacterium]
MSKKNFFTFIKYSQKNVIVKMLSLNWGNYSVEHYGLPSCWNSKDRQRRITAEVVSNSARQPGQVGEYTDATVGENLFAHCCQLFEF